MSKSLVVCCDGTWNLPDESTPTNVTKIALAAAPVDLSGREQRTYYHAGVGTGRFDRILGGVFGFGLSRNVRDAYRFLVQNFEPGDDIYFFGFSRGAFTARSIAGFIRNSGILRRENADRLNDAWRLYCSRSSKAHPRSIEAELFRRSYSHETRIRFIGVWDTVGALGIPLQGLHLVDVLNRKSQFHDTSLSTSVDAAFHALSIDERDGPMRPALWMPQPDAPDHQRIEQVWFPGDHNDVGGGWRDHGLSDIPLLWMVDRARQCGLNLDLEALADVGSVQPDPLARAHTPQFFRHVRPFVRELGVVDETHEYLASTAVQRHKLTSYAPRNLLKYLNDTPRFMPVPDDKLTV